MAYDKIIDSAVLDAGMVATANAIREKTGGTEQIPWEDEKGFSSAVADISKGVSKIPSTLTCKQTNPNNTYIVAKISYLSEPSGSRSWQSLTFSSNESTYPCNIGDVVVVYANKSVSTSGNTNTSAPTISITGGVVNNIMSTSKSGTSYKEFYYVWAVIITSATASITVRN